MFIFYTFIMNRGHIMKKSLPGQQKCLFSLSKGGSILMDRNDRQALGALPRSKIAVRVIANHAGFENQEPGRG
jgi:hypothetical protein